MKRLPTLTLILGLCLTLAPRAQTLNTPQQITLQGLLANASFNAAAYAPDGSLILLLNQHDGIRLLKTNASATSIITQSQTGSTGDTGLALSLDPSGNIYVTGTTTSNTLTATPGAAFPTHTSSFLAKYDTNLNLLFLTFLGAPQTTATSIAATAAGAFITGTTSSTTLPVTPTAIQQSPAPNATQSGFVEAFTPTGALTYATYLTGANGTLTPTAIAADTSGNAYITGSTTSPGLPTISALVPNILGTTSGFLTALSPTGSSFLYATYIPGNGLASIALDATTQTLLLTGNVNPGQFPLTTVTTPLANTPYQTLLRIPLNGQSITSSTLLVPGTQSFATPGPNSTVWISGSLTTPLFPGPIAPDYPAGDSFLLHLTTNNTIDQTLRFGGLPTTNAGYASLTSLVSAPAISPTGTVALPGTLTVTTNTIPQPFDFPLVQTPNAILPNTLADILPTVCTQCTGTAAFLSLLNTTTSAPSLSLSTNDLPNITLRNLGSAAATGLTLTVTGYTLATNCATTLQPSNSCSIALTGTGPGTLTVSSTNATTATLTLPTTTLTPNPIALSTNELDFGIVTSTSPPATQTLILTNLTTTPQPFTSALDGPTTPYTFAETATTCTSHIVPASSTCTLTFSFTASTTSDTPAANFWKIASHDIKLTGFSQVAAVNLSSTEVDFGTQFTNTPTLNLPRYLYLSNNSTTPIPHTPATLPITSPFTVTDNCPTTLEPHTVCSLTLIYLSPTAPSDDATTLTLDNNQTVLLTGQTFPPTGATSSTANPYLTVSTVTVNFATPVTVTAVSTTAQTVTLTNTGTVPFPLTTSLTGDFLLNNTCPTTLSANTSCQLFLNFAPSQPAEREGLLSITSGSAFAPTLISLTGIASAILPANNGTLTLGQTYINEPTTLYLLIQQSLPTLTAASNSPLFNVALIPSTGTPPKTLPQSSFTPTATSSCTICYLGVQFLSQTSGPQSATLTLTTVPNGNPYLLTLIGTALPIQGLLLSPISQDFGPVNVHSTSAPITFTLANLLSPASPVTITSATTTGDFTLINPSCTGTLPTTASCYLQISFSPTVTGARTGTLTLTTSAGTLIASLTGFGNPDPGLSLTPNFLIFTPTTNTQTVSLTNTGTATLTISTPSTSTTNFATNSNCTTLIPAATCTLTVQFIPTTSPIADTLTLPVTTTQNGQSETAPYTIPLTGTYTAEDAGLQILPAQINFGSTSTGTIGNTRQFTLNNLTTKTLAITLNLPRQFPLAEPSTCTTLAPSASCTFSITFLPITNGPLTGTVFAQGIPTDNSAPVQSLTYLLGYGQGAGTLTVTGLPIPYTPLNFGQLTSGQTAQQTLTLTNSGTTPITLHRITSDPPFLTATTCLPTLTPDSTCTVTLTYAPIYELPTTSTNLTPRTDTGTLILESDSANSPTILDFAGTVAPILSQTPANPSILATFQLSQSSLTFPNTTIGAASPAQTITLTNTGTTTLHILNTLASTSFTATTTCTTLNPGTACPINIQLTPAPTSTNPILTGTLEIQSDAATSLEFVTLLGTASDAPLTLNPTTLNFGTVNISTTGQLPLQITNTTTSPLTFNNITTTGDFSYTPNTCPANNSTLAAAATCTLTITFAPTSTGPRTGTLSLSTDATTLPLTISLSGTGAQSQLQITPGALAFGSISIGSPAPLTLTLLNTGTAPVTNISAAITGTGFALTSPCPTTTLAPNQGCTATVTFTPTTIGSQSATLSLTSSDPNSPATIPLTGTGVASTSGSFTLTVDGSTSQTITITSGSPATYNLNLTPTNSFTGIVALTCSPINAAQYATCSLLSPTLTLNATPQATTATLNTITSEAHSTILRLSLLLTPLLFLRRRKLRAAALLSVLCIAISACGGGSTPTGGSEKLLYTPAGTYQYKVTATSTSGPTITSTVTLNLIVQ